MRKPSRPTLPGLSYRCVTFSILFKRHHDYSEELTMITKTKFALAALLMLGVASTAQAGGVDRGSTISAVSCPALEGYPDCHPDARTLLLKYPTNSRHPNRSH
jgi:hypothetical protein